MIRIRERRKGERVGGCLGARSPPLRGQARAPERHRKEHILRLQIGMRQLLCAVRERLEAIGAMHAI